MSPRQPHDTEAEDSSSARHIIPSGVLKQLHVSDIKPNPNNPRALFDEDPLKELRENIREHGVLVPITVYPLAGQNKYAILDGERRFRCCVDLEKEGKRISLPANIVQPPSKIANLLYMFSIHNFREQWELMPTALSLKVVMEELDEDDNVAIAKLTGLSEPQIERCKKLLSFPERFQNLSMDPDPKTRIPSNFWIEAYPVLELCPQVVPDLVRTMGRDGITDRLVEKYRAKRIKSVIHFRRILEAFELANGNIPRVSATLRSYIKDVNLETRSAFDGFIVDNRRIRGAIAACEEFIDRLERAKITHALEREELVQALVGVKEYVESLIHTLEGSDAPEAGEGDEPDLLDSK